MMQQFGILQRSPHLSLVVWVQPQATQSAPILTQAMQLLAKHKLQVTLKTLSGVFASVKLSTSEGKGQLQMSEHLALTIPFRLFHVNLL